MLNDVHVMVLVIVASQAGIAILLIVMAVLEPGRPGRNTPGGAARQVPVHREAARRSPAAGRHRW